MNSELHLPSGLDLDSIPPDEEVVRLLRALEPPGLPRFPNVLRIDDANGVRVVPIDRDALRVGAAPDNDVVVAGAEPHHLRIWRFAFGLVVARHAAGCSLDLVSARGREVQLPINMGLLTAGDAVRIGGATLTALLGDDEAPAEGDFQGIVGRSLAMARLYLSIARTAPSPLSVLVQGANGAGKEAVAHALHRLSGRAAGPFVTLDCTGLTAELLKDQLFGHEKNAYTDAKEARPGRFELADGGTLFLDEMGELPLAFQATFLRALQCGEVTRLGSHEVRKVNVRIVAATNVDLSLAVSEGRFREDLYYRLADMTLTVPGLTERLEDVPRLARYFLTKHAPAGTRVELSAGALDLLLAHSWRGNVRELEAVIRRALVLSWNPTEIDAADIQFNTPAPRAAAEPPPIQPELDPNRWLDLHHLKLEDGILQMKRRAVLRHDGNKTAAATELGVSRTTLRNIDG